jgi:hypothetical protein
MPDSCVPKKICPIGHHIRCHIEFAYNLFLALGSLNLALYASPERSVLPLVLLRLTLLYALVPNIPFCALVLLRLVLAKCTKQKKLTTAQQVARNFAQTLLKAIRMAQ